MGALSFTACNSGSGDQQNDGTTTTSGEPVVAADADATLTDEKRDFMGYAYRNGMKLEELGRLATEKGASEEVRSHGRQLVDQYAGKQEELRQLAQEYSVQLPQNMDQDQMDIVTELRETPNQEFDQKYWEDIVDVYEDTIGEFDSKLKDYEETNNVTFNVWARNTRKEMQAQMETAMRYRLGSRRS